MTIGGTGLRRVAVLAAGSGLIGAGIAAPVAGAAAATDGSASGISARELPTPAELRKCVQLTGAMGGPGDAPGLGGSCSEEIFRVRVATIGLPQGVVGQAYSAQLSATPGKGALRWKLDRSGSQLPDGLSISESGLISGVPTAAASVHVSFDAIDDIGSRTEVSLKLEVLPAGSVPSVTSVTNRPIPARHTASPHTPDKIYRSKRTLVLRSGERTDLDRKIRVKVSRWTKPGEASAGAKGFKVIKDSGNVYVRNNGRAKLIRLTYKAQAPGGQKGRDSRASAPGQTEQYRRIHVYNVPGPKPLGDDNVNAWVTNNTSSNVSGEWAQVVNPNTPKWTFTVSPGSSGYLPNPANGGTSQNLTVSSDGFNLANFIFINPWYTYPLVQYACNFEVSLYLSTEGFDEGQSETDGVCGFRATMGRNNDTDYKEMYVNLARP